MSRSIRHPIQLAVFVGAIGALALALAAEAPAATITQGGSTQLTYTAGPDEINNLVVTFEAQTNRFVFRETGTTTGGGPISVVKPTACLASQPGVVACPRLSVGRINVDLLDGADTFSAAGVLMNFRIDGGPGADNLRGGDVADTFLASGRLGADEYSGGPGHDRITYEDRAVPLTITLDDVADDGSSGEGDNVHGDIEEVDGGRGPDTIIGNAESNDLEGRDGNDILEGGAGFDRLSGGAGFDNIRSRDGLRDNVNCGGQTFDVVGFDVDFDIAFADLPDAVEDCFFVDQAAKEHGPGVSISRRALRERGGAVAPRLTCPATPAAGCSGKLRLERVNRRGRPLARVGAASYAIEAGSRENVPVKLNRSARRLLDSDGALAIRATAVEKDDRNRDKTVYATLLLRDGS